MVDDEKLPDLAGKCPFCGGDYFVITAQYAIAHSTPPCARFLALDPPAFLHEVNVKLRKDTPT